jgi:ADP-ribosyl-[dinitrogen reductase] hydrolase
VGDTDDGLAANHGLIILTIGQSNQGMNQMVYTSHTHPLRIDGVDIPGVPGTIGITLCPGKVQRDAISGAWERDLRIDIQAVKSWGATGWLNLLTRKEMLNLKVKDLEVAVKESGIRYYCLPIEDGDIPDAVFEKSWKTVGTQLREELLRGGKILIHCKGGLGRSGMIAARLIVELGAATPEAAIRRVRASRPGAIETHAQEEHVLTTKVC